MMRQRATKAEEQRSEMNEKEVLELSESEHLKKIMKNSNSPKMAESDLLREMVKKGSSRNAQSYLNERV